MNKRGISAIVATLIIILLAIVIFAVVSVVVKKTVTEGSEDVEFEVAASEVDLSIKKVVIGSASVTVYSSTGMYPFDELTFAFYTDDASMSVTRPISIGPGETKTSSFSDEELFPVKSGELTSILIYVGSSDGRISKNPSTPPFEDPFIQREESCNDNDGDNYDDCELDYPGDDGREWDCNDNDFYINPGVEKETFYGEDEACKDGEDNDCDGSWNCDDDDCLKIIGLCQGNGDLEEELAKERQEGSYVSKTEKRIMEHFGDYLYFGGNLLQKIKPIKIKFPIDIKPKDPCPGILAQLAELKAGGETGETNSEIAELEQLAEENGCVSCDSLENEILTKSNQIVTLQNNIYSTNDLIVLCQLNPQHVDCKNVVISALQTSITNWGITMIDRRAELKDLLNEFLNLGCGCDSRVIDLLNVVNGGTVADIELFTKSLFDCLSNL